MGLIRTLDRTYICREIRLSLLQNVQKMDKTSQKPFIKQDMLSMAREAEMMKNMREHLTAVTSWRKNIKEKEKDQEFISAQNNLFFSTDFSGSVIKCFRHFSLFTNSIEERYHLQ